MICYCLILFRVSQDAEVSEDEEDGDKDDEYEDSFIDDKTNPTPTQAEHSGDMLAFYRCCLSYLFLNLYKNIHMESQNHR